DAAAYGAGCYDIEEQNAGATTVDLKVNYLAPAGSGKLIANGRQIKLGKTLGYAEAKVTAENGKILAHGTSTLILLAGKGLTSDPPLPLKVKE
ncbi:MAG: PaaI family thioesterase, partial [Deltaproteobacteria bacterium]|nr:PaaI family thioesterase [Deltaproteobacteria bacterium]